MLACHDSAREDSRIELSRETNGRYEKDNKETFVHHIDKRKGLKS